MKVLSQGKRLEISLSLSKEHREKDTKNTFPLERILRKKTKIKTFSLKLLMKEKDLKQDFFTGKKRGKKTLSYNPYFLSLTSGHGWGKVVALEAKRDYSFPYPYRDK